MKKITTTLIATAAVAIALTSCDGLSGTPKPTLKNDIDTLSYAMGIAQTQGLREYLAQMDIDTTYMNSFIKGINDGAAAGDDKKKSAYYAGVSIGQKISKRMISSINRDLFGDDSVMTVSKKNFVAGFARGASGNKKYMPADQAQVLAQVKSVAVRTKYIEDRYAPNKKAGEEWLAQNAKNDSVVVLPSGVQYKVIKEGTGKIPSDTSKVKVNYVGRLIDGTEVDNSYKRKNNEPVELKANQVIKGWTEALVRMPVGSRWQVYVPQELAYGDRSMSKIQPFSALVFDIELVDAE